MARIRSDGSIQSANTPSRNLLSSEKTEIDSGMYRCMVVEVYYIDDKGNLTFSNQQVTYDCIILGGRKEGQIIPNCKLASLLGGQYNYHEHILRKAESPFAGDQSKKLSEQKGDIVYVQFVQKMANPVIIGLGAHPLDQIITGAKKSDGPIWHEEYNGINRNISKDGEFVLTRKGGIASDKGYFIPADRQTEEEGGSTAENEFLSRLRMEGKQLVIEDPKSKIILDLENETLEATVGENKGTFLKINGKEGSITIDADGGTNQIKIDSSGEITIKSTTKVKIEAPLVDVGEGASFSSTVFESLMSEFAAHTHNAPQAPSGMLPTTPPLAPLMSLVGSQTIKIKD